MHLILLSFLFGLVLGLWPRTQELIVTLSQRLLSFGLILLLFFLGASLGSHPNITSQLEVIGLKSLVHASFTVAGSILIVWILERWFVKHDNKRR